jgi:NADH:ubiquinone reductase (H+-translocating)
MTRRILIIGAGFAGLWSALAAVRRLRLEGSAPGAVEIAVVAPEAALTMRPRLYEAAPGDMVAPLQQLFDDTGVRHIQGMVVTIRADKDEVEIVDAQGQRMVLAYDRLVLAAGSSLIQPNIPGLREFSFNVDQRGDAVALDAHLQRLAAEPSSPTRNTVVVAGGGFTGIEMAAELPARLRAILGQDEDIQVIVVERGETIGPDLGPGPRPVIEQALAELGVTCRLGAAVAQVDADGLYTSSGERIAAGTIIWTAGVRASALTEQIPGRRDGAGRLRVEHDLRVAASPRVFATGDAAVAATDDAGNHTLMSCQHAMFLGRSAGDNAVADLLGLATRAYRQPGYVTCLDLGAWGAVVTQGWERKVWLTGSEAKAMKIAINSKLIYPPADAAAALAAADPALELSL